MSRNKAKAAEFVNEAYDISITGRNVLITDAMKDYALEKISKIERIAPRILEVIVTMDIQKLDQRVDIIVKVNNLRIKSHAITPDMYASIDKAVDKLDAQLRRYKTKLQDHHIKGMKDIDMNVNVIRPHLEDELKELNDDIFIENMRTEEGRYRPHKIIGQETLPLKYLTLNEAILKMEISGEAFLIFMCEEDQKLKVIYRHQDGNYGIIEPEPAKLSV